MSQVSLAEWQQFLEKHPGAHILQTGEWGELKAAFGWEPVRLVTGEQGLQILFRKLPLGFTLAYAPKPLLAGSITGQLAAEIDALCRKKRAIFIKLEPDAWENGTDSIDQFNQFARPSPHNIQPLRTIEVSLAGSDEDILARMKQKCRYNIRLAEKKGVIIRAWDDLEGFHQLIRVTGDRDGFGVHSLEYYRKAYQLFHAAGKAELLVAEFEGRPLAALMVFASGSRSWYLYGASNDQERNRMPTYLLQWEAMKWAKMRGCATYDLWGVPDVNETTLEAQFETRHDGLWGVYRFKRGFGGQVRRAVQAVDRLYNPWLYRLYLWRVKPGEA